MHRWKLLLVVWLVSGTLPAVHPNRAGFIAMAGTVDISAFDRPCKWRK